MYNKLCKNPISFDALCLIAKIVPLKAFYGGKKHKTTVNLAALKKGIPALYNF